MGTFRTRSKIYNRDIEFTYLRKYDRVLNMRRDAIMKGFWIFHDSKYAWFLHMQGLYKVLNMPEYGWSLTMRLNNAEYAWICPAMTG